MSGKSRLTSFELFATTAKQKALQALTPNAPRNPDEKACNWCKAKAQCPALQAFVEDVIGQQFDDLTVMPEVATLSLEQMTKVLKSKKLITSFIDAVEQLATDRLLSGQPMPGFKLVEGRSVRTIKDEAQVAQALIAKGYQQEQIYKPATLRGITDLEKLVGKKEFSLTVGEWVVKPKGAPTIASMDDPREPLSDVSSADFK